MCLLFLYRLEGGDPVPILHSEGMDAFFLIISPLLRNELLSWIPGQEKSKLRLEFLMPGMTPVGVFFLNLMAVVNPWGGESGEWLS